MKVGEVKRLAQDHRLDQLEDAATSFEKSRRNDLNVIGEDEGEVMSHILAAVFVRQQLDSGKDLNQAVREYSQRVRSILSSNA